MSTPYLHELEVADWLPSYMTRKHFGSWERAHTAKLPVGSDYPGKSRGPSRRRVRFGPGRQSRYCRMKGKPCSGRRPQRMQPPSSES